jgi:hypothetical protein
MRLAAIAVAVIVASATGGCASVGSGGTQDVTVRSYPDAADITITLDGTVVHTGASPATVTLARGNSLLNRKQYDVTVTKAGYEPRSFKLTWAGGWNLGTLVLGPQFGMICIDPETGMTWKVDTTTMATPLDGSVEVISGDAQEFVITTADRVPLTLWKYAERIR